MKFYLVKRRRIITIISVLLLLALAIFAGRRTIYLEIWGQLVGYVADPAEKKQLRSGSETTNYTVILKSFSPNQKRISSRFLV